MRAYWGEEDAGDGRVGEGAAGGEGVRGGACGCGYDATVCLDDGEEIVVAVEFEVRDVGGGAAVDDEFVQDFELFAFGHFRRGGAGEGAWVTG